MERDVKQCQNCRKEFAVEPVDFVFYDKMKVPTPTWCPECRGIRRMLFASYCQLFRKTEKRTGNVLFCTYPETSDIEVYERDYWYSDAWDAFSYGREVDFSRPFLAQLFELSRKVPWPSKSARELINSKYSNQASYLKNCYLCLNGGTAENCLYCISFIGIRDCMDVFSLLSSELCYEIYQGARNYQCFFSSDVEDCRDVWFSKDMRNCSNCFGCYGLRGKQYNIFNEQYSKEEYEAKIKELNKGSFAAVQGIKKKAYEVELTVPHKYFHGVNNVDVSGDYIYGSKNAHDVYEVGGAENVRFSENINAAKDSYDYTSWGENSELMYEAAVCGDQCSNVKFSADSWPAMRDTEYSLNCHSSANVFGCVGLRKKQYCILNKQYSKDEYEALVPKIIEHMNKMPYKDPEGREYKYGEFFPPQFSPLAYNETIANEYYPRTKEEVQKLGFLWRDPDLKEYSTTITADALPDHISEAQDSITKEVIQCADCKRAYRILEPELAFYRRFEIPVPHLCHRCRHKLRIGQRNPRLLYERSCMKAGCSNSFKTTYAPLRPEIVYCESCYNAAVA